MPRFTLYREQNPSQASPAKRGMLESAAAATEVDRIQALHSDPDVTVVAEMPEMLLIECSASAAKAWSKRLPEWTIQPERKARIPDPRPRVRRSAQD